METTDDRAVPRRMQRLCIQAMNAELDVDDLAAEFPDGAPRGEYWEMVYEDLVDGVEHLPATFFGKLDVGAWRNSEVYATLQLHVLLLSGRDELHQLAGLYRHVRGHAPLVLETLPKLVAQARETVVGKSDASEGPAAAGHG